MSTFTRSMRSWSAIHKVRNCFPTLVKPRTVGGIVNFAVPDRAVYKDTYADSSIILNFTYNGIAYEIGTIFDDEYDITGHLVLHEIGNGINDNLLNKVILEAMPDSSWTSYDYSTTVDPYLFINMRSSGWVDGQGENSIDLVALNMAVKGGLNPFCSVMQTPNVEGTGDRVSFNGDDRYTGGTPSDAQGKPVESLVLSAPINTKFRRMLLSFRSSKVVVIRSVTVIMSEYVRRGWG